MNQRLSKTNSGNGYSATSLTVATQQNFYIITVESWTPLHGLLSWRDYKWLSKLWKLGGHGNARCTVKVLHPVINRSTGLQGGFQMAIESNCAIALWLV